MDDKQKAGWMAAALLSANAGKVDGMAAQVGAFYQGLRQSGVSEGAAILMTQTFITALVSAAAPIAAAKGAK